MTAVDPEKAELMADDVIAEDTPSYNRSSVPVVIIILVLVSLLGVGFFINPDTSDRYQLVCEVKGHLWVQPTHGEPYCGDGTGNPRD